MRDQVLLALDLASTTGWAVFHGSKRHASGVIVLKRRVIAKVRQPRAVAYIQLIDLLDQSLEGEGPIPFIRHPDMLAIEGAGMGYGSKAAAEMSHGLLAHVETWAYLHGFPFKMMLNWTVKKHATGKSMADKDEMMKAARKLWRGVRLADDNEADALHVGRAYIDGL